MPDLDPELPESSLVTVYEAVNETRKELYVGLSTFFVPEIERRLRSKLALSHWSPQDRIVIRAIEYGIPLSMAREFTRAYEQSRVDAGWKRVPLLSESPAQSSAKTRAARQRSSSSAQ